VANLDNQDSSNQEAEAKNTPASEEQLDETPSSATLHNETVADDKTEGKADAEKIKAKENLEAAGKIEEHQSETVAGEKTEVKLDVEQIKAKKLTVAGKIEDQTAETINNYNTVFSQEETILEELSLKHFTLFELEEIEKVGLFFEESEMNQLIRVITKQNLLFLVGEPELGKTTLAQSVASQLRRQDYPLSQILFSWSVDKNVIVNIDKIASSVQEYRHKMIIFKDAFASKHNDMINFVKELESLKERESLRLKSIATKLRENHIFIVFTSDSEVMKTHEITSKNIKRLGILHEMLPPDSNKLTQGICQQVDRFIHSQLATHNSNEVEVLRQSLTDEHATNVANKLRTMPRVIRFIEEYSLDIAQKKLSVEQALEQFDNLDLKKWFFKELATDFDVWCFALALVLSYSSHVFDCYWIQFYQFHRTLLKFLNRELQTATDEQEEQQQTIGILPPDDDILLQKVRAEVEQQLSYPFADIIRFHDNSYPEQLWKVLFKSGRSILTLLIPLLKELALNQDFYLQRSAAKALGRIGEMDRNYVVFPLIREGLRSEQESYHIAVGYIFQGILGSTDQDYHEDCLRQLRNFLSGDSGDKIWAGIMVLLMIGYVNLGLSMRELKNVVVTKFRNKIAALKTSHKKLQELEDLLISQSDRTKYGDIVELQHKELLQMIAAEVFSKKEQEILGAVQHCIVSLSLYLDPVQVMKELLYWMKEKPKNLAPLVGLLFIRFNGIADKLERNWITKAAVNKKGNTSRIDSRILLEASRSEASTQILTNFLEQTFISFSAFPSFFRRPLQSNFIALLKIWAMNACKIEKIRPTVENILAGLYRVMNKELQDAIYRLLKEDPDFAEKGSKLRELATDVMTRPIKR
jgi:hypothetical protein